MTQPTCDATILDKGRPRQCQKDDGHYPATRHRSVLRDGADVLTWNDDAKYATPASSSPPRVTARTTRHTVSALPEGFEEAWRWGLTVQQQRDGYWIVGDGTRLLDIDGNWGSPGAAWQSRFQHTEEWALKLAKAEAPNVTVNGITPADAVARSKEQ